MVLDVLWSEVWPNLRLLDHFNLFDSTFNVSQEAKGPVRSKEEVWD